MSQSQVSSCSLAVLEVHTVRLPQLSLAASAFGFFVSLKAISIHIVSRFALKYLPLFYKNLIKSLVNKCNQCVFKCKFIFLINDIFCLILVFCGLCEHWPIMSPLWSLNDSLGRNMHTS